MLFRGHQASWRNFEDVIVVGKELRSSFLHAVGGVVILGVERNAQDLQACLLACSTLPGKTLVDGNNNRLQSLTSVIAIVKST
jgi:hypothetical protein